MSGAWCLDDIRRQWSLWAPASWGVTQKDGENGVSLSEDCLGTPAKSGQTRAVSPVSVPGLLHFLLVPDC